MRTAYGGFWRHIKYDGKNIAFVSTYPCIMKPHSPLTMHIPHSVGRRPYWSSPPRPHIVGRRPYWSSPPRPHPSPTAPHMVAAMVGYRAIRQGVYRSYVGGHIGAVLLGHIPALPLHIWWQRSVAANCRRQGTQMPPSQKCWEAKRSFCPPDFSSPYRLALATE